MTNLRTHKLLALMPAGTQPAKLDRDFPTTILYVLLFCLAAVIAASAQSAFFTTLVNFNVNFDGTNGANPQAALIQATDGNFYGTTTFGGYDGEGTVFKMTPGGTLTTLASFDDYSGFQLEAGLVQASDGNFYGTAHYGGDEGFGTVFRITSSGGLSVLYNFCNGRGCPDGALPDAGLVQASDGNFYGTTYAGGAYGAGTVFEISTAGELTTLYSFCSEGGCTDGANPTADLAQASDGNFYGTTSAGGAYGTGTIFKITTAGSLITLYSFDFPGVFSIGGLVQASDGSFYGTTATGGNLACNVGYGCGTIFRITSLGVLTTLYTFCPRPNCTDGAFPYAALVEGRDGNLYGTTAGGGNSSGDGTVFEITPAGTLTTLHRFDGSDGESPYGGLMQAGNGFFYGTTYSGGANGGGTVFRLGLVNTCATCRP